jgi:signal transduction histidine kinase
VARILVVDDDPNLLRITARLLAGAGHAVAMADSGVAGVDRARAEPPDLVLLDLVLPDINGLEVCRRIKAMHGDTFVVLMSGVEYDSETQARSLEAGADGFIARTVSNRELLARVQSLLRLKAAEDALREARAELERRVEARTLELVSANAALRLEVIERQAAEARAQREAERARSLLRVAGHLNTRLDLDAVLNAVCDETARALATRAVVVTVYDSAAAVLRPAAWCGLPTEPSALADAIPRATCDAVMGDAPFVVVPDLRALERVSPIFARLPADLSAVAGARMVLEGELIGTLSIHSPPPRQYTADELALLKGLADLAAVAVANARLVDGLRRRREQVQRLAMRLAGVEEAERKRLAVELHDQVGQHLTALSLNLSILQTELAATAPLGVLERLADSLALVEETAGRVRDVMAELRPPVLDDYGLLAALRWYASQVQARSGIPIAVEGEEPCPRLDAAIEMALFRVAQEALTNVLKHARATRVRLSLADAGQTVQLSVADDGVGFDATAATAGHDAPPSGWGLMTMAERAAAVGGRWRVESQPGAGTRVVVEVAR